MEATEGLRRGVEAVDTGAPISVPVGECVLGRIFNVLGKPLDSGAEVNNEEKNIQFIDQLHHLKNNQLFLKCLRQE